MWKWIHIKITPYHLFQSKYNDIYTVLPVLTKKFGNNHNQDFAQITQINKQYYYYCFHLSLKMHKFVDKKKSDNQKMALDISFHLFHSTLGLKHHLAPFFANDIVDQPVFLFVNYFCDLEKLRQPTVIQLFFVYFKLFQIINFLLNVF